MSYMKNNSYRDMPFCPGTQRNEFYTYIELIKIPEKCQTLLETVIKCRTLGILQSLNGRFYLSDLNTSASNSEPIVQVSMAYMHTPAQSTVMPYPVQIFGTLQWKNRPVIFAKIIQVLDVPTAIRLKKALNNIVALHLATTEIKDEDEIEDPT